MTLSTPLLVAAPLLAGLMGPALLGAAPAPRQDDGLVTTPVPTLERTRVVEHVAARTAAEQQRVLAYWTPQRMAQALPIDLLGLVTDGRRLLRGLPGGAALTRTTRHLIGAPAFPRAVASKLPMPSHQLGHQVDRQLSRQPAARPEANTIGARWITGGAVTRTTGRVFMTVGGADFVCSASTVTSANRDVVVTAGHCVKDGVGQWAANWTFVPGYGAGGEHPYGRYAARRMFVAERWSRAADDNYDVAMVALATSGGTHVADAVGTQEIAFNAPRGGQAFGFGYPADPPYNGGQLVYCAGRLRDDPHGQTRDQGLGCDMTAGSSGGPWMTGFDADTGKGTITSLSSFKYSDDPRTMYGPYLGEAAKTLFDTAQRA
ncbi:trypsin-like serine protease [Nonomuraea sp. NBC_00507]|uniref:trypsin-like serine peptidase n=1 Tax=Nonomuraea sp. NBC_00507 TaxID=2976002 RepID=UPI002E18C79E